jgi:hypothetical protein
MQPLWADQRILGSVGFEKTPSTRATDVRRPGVFTLVAHHAQKTVEALRLREMQCGWSQTDDGCNSPSVFLQRGRGQRAAGCELRAASLLGQF